MKISEMSVELIDHCGSDLSVVNAARVSFHKESKWEEDLGPENWQCELSGKDKKLIDYLARHNHKSPFNHCFLSFRVKAPIFVARQLVKHEYLPWNEVSRRYVSEEPEFWFPRTWRKSAENVKQGSSAELVTEIDFIHYDGEHQTVSPGDLTKWSAENSERVYRGMLACGVCPEQARMVLPQNVMTEWIWSGTLFAFVKMCRLRLHPHAQQETREVALLVSKHIQELFPVSYESLMENNCGT